MIVISRYCADALHAGPKAKTDIESILNDRYDATIKTLKYKKIEEDNKLLNVIRNIKGTFFTHIYLKSKEITIIQYPCYPHFFLSTKKYKNRIAYVHDLFGLRHNNQRKNKRDINFLKTCKYIIVHNKKMKNYLVSEGIHAGDIYVLELFDYLCQGKNNVENIKLNINNPIIIYSGWLKQYKTPFIYQLEEKKMKFTLALYGNGIKKENINSSKIKYKGAFEPHELPGKIEGNLGLVWDGNFDESDENDGLKNYTKYNNPHKLSCYIATGIPVIVWRKAAVADFVKKYNIGYTISNIYDINNLDISDYDEKLKNVQELSKKVREGYFTKRVMDKIVEDIKKNGEP